MSDQSEGAAGRTSSPAQQWAQQWARLSERQRTLLVGAAAAELSLKIAALVDIARRPAEQIRGPKMLWRAAMVVNLLGPLSYFLFGRRR
jgi:Phospholipase_D-nuclease N-terminal